MSTESIRNYYREIDEWGRLDTPAGQLEMVRCMRLLDDHLPRQAAILDAGGGPGRYAVELARRGHRVTLVDLCPEHVETAREKLGERRLLNQMDGLYEGDVCDLSKCDDQSFDAVVAFGPFYHLVEDAARREAAGEIARVLRPGAKAFVQFLPPLSGFVRLLDRASDSPAKVSPEVLRAARREQRYRNPTDRGFQEGNYSRPEQMESLFLAVGLRTVDVVSVSGLAAGRERQLLELHRRDPQLYDEFENLFRQMARDPAVISLGQTAVWIGQRPS